ncbi:MAG: hypothetical protein IJV93_08710 [Lentisphaeria bacterium]|nr:hypothetical protein [Lentisphaeria bacterium]
MKKRFIISLCCGSAAALCLILWLTYWYIPRLNTEGWLKEVLWCKLDIASKISSPKIIIAGGSNAFWGMDSAEIEKRCGVPVVNLAFHASFPLNFYNDLLADVLNAGDVVILPLELGHYGRKESMNTTVMKAGLGWAKEFFPNEISSVEIMTFYMFPYIWRENILLRIPKKINSFRNERYRDKASVLREFYQGCKHIKQVDPDEILPESAVYSFRNMNQYGDIVNTRNLKEISIVPFKHKIIPSAFFLKEIRKLAQMARSRNAKIALTWPVLHKGCYDLQRLRDFQKECKKYGIVIYGDPSEFLFPEQSFSDTHYHLRTSAAKKRAGILAECINKYNLQFEAYTKKL